MNKYQTRRFFLLFQFLIDDTTFQFLQFFNANFRNYHSSPNKLFFNLGRFEVKLLLIWFSLFCIFRSSILGKKYQRKMLLSCRKPPSKSSRHRKRSTSRFPTKRSILRPKNQSLSRKIPTRSPQRKWTMKLN